MAKGIFYPLKIMDDTYDWVGDYFPIKNNTTYGQIHNNFTAGAAGSVYNTVDMVTSPEYLGAKAYSVAAYPKQILAAANLSGRDAARGLQGVAGKIKNKEYGSLARSAGYVAGSAAQAYALGKGIEKCGDLINKKKYGTGTYADGMPLEDATASLEGGSKTISYTDYDNIYQSSIHNAGKDKVMLGKYDGGGSTSYITKAGDDYSYFSLGNEWNTIKAKYGYKDDDMFKLFNEAFLDDGINAGKTFQFSHNPINDTGALGQEYQYLLRNNYKWDAGTMTMKPRH